MRVNEGVIKNKKVRGVRLLFILWLQLSSISSVQLPPFLLLIFFQLYNQKFRSPVDSKSIIFALPLYVRSPRSPPHVNLFKIGLTKLVSLAVDAIHCIGNFSFDEVIRTIGPRGLAGRPRNFRNHWCCAWRHSLHERGQSQQSGNQTG